MGSLQDSLPQPVSDELEQAVLDLLQRKMAEAAWLYVTAVRAAKQTYGPAAAEAIRTYQLQQSLDRCAARGAQGDNSLRAFCRALEQGCRGSHEWIKLEDTETRQAYHFTRCLWADIFRSLGAQDIGFWICANDGPAVAAFNPRIRFQRTKTLMEGADCCDHTYYLSDEA